MSYVDEALNDPDWLESLESGVYSYTALRALRAETNKKTDELKAKVEQ